MLNESGPLVRVALLLTLASASSLQAQPRARNVILVVGDGVGLTSLNAASIMAHQQPQALFLHRMPGMAFAATASTSHWVTDAGAAATAFATGRSTANRMLSAFPPASPSGTAELAAKTLLDYAEDRGLATGGISDTSIANPLIAAFYARQANRSDLGEVFLQMLTPRSGDGLDFVVGPGRREILASVSTTAADLDTRFAAKGYQLRDQPPGAKDAPGAKRTVALLDQKDFDLAAVVQQAIAVLSRNPQGYFLVIHVDCHLRDAQKSLNRVVELDRLVSSLAAQHAKDTLILMTADHSYGLRVEGQKIPRSAAFLSQVSLLDDHTGEDVPVLAIGPGSERVRGFVPNTQIFHWIWQAYGWKGIAAPNSPDRQAQHIGLK